MNTEHPLAGCRGIVNGLILSAVFWIIWIAETDSEILPDDAAEEHDRQMEIGFAREGY